jgi:ABC-type dipeptide/oligopeptide/nickel transport system ATPase component
MDAVSMTPDVAVRPVLSIRSLSTQFSTPAGVLKAVQDVSLDVLPGECLGVVGESGSGKSVTFASVMGLIRPPGQVTSGQVLLDGVDLRQLAPEAMRSVRGKRIAMTMQDALTALNPALTVQQQLLEVILAHDEDVSALPRWQRRRRARERAIEMMSLVGIPSAETRLNDYPHQFSGGMRQRIMIAIALACKPRLLIADEPTTALDVTIQAQVLELIASLRRSLGMTVVLITHDLGVVSEECDRVIVMYAGQVLAVELDHAGIGFHQPQDGAPEGRFAAARLADEPQRFAALQRQAHAVDCVHDAALRTGEHLREAARALEMLDEILDTKQGSRAHRSASIASTQRAWCTPGRNSSGMSLRQRSWRCEQRE